MEDLQDLNFKDVELFRDSLFYESLEVKLETIKRLPSLAQAIGPEKTRNQLLTLLDLELSLLENEVVYILTEKLADFFPLIGGPEFSQKVFTILLKIGKSVDETLIRERAIETLRKLIEETPPNFLEEYLIKEILKVNDTEVEWFSQKCTYLKLIPICYPKASKESKALLRQKFKNIFNENIALTRKAAGEQLKEFVKVLEMEFLLSEFLTVLMQIEEDTQDCVKITAVDVTLNVARRSNNMEIKNDMLHKINNLTGTSSWRIRNTVASKIDTVSEIFQDDSFIPTVLFIYQTLVNDRENDVRISAARHLFTVFNNLNNAIKQESSLNFEKIFKDNLIPIINTLYNDECTEVETQLSLQILSLSSLISKKVFIESLLPIIIQGLKSEKSVAFKENLLLNLDNLPHGVNIIKYFDSISNVLEKLIENSDKSWRIRRCILLNLVDISQYCDEEYFNNNLLICYLKLLIDPVFAVRRTATIILPLLSEKYGSKWLITKIIPEMYSTYRDESYLFRYLILFGIQEVISPTAHENPLMRYLNYLKEHLKNEVHLKELCKIVRLNFKLQETLQDNFFSQFKTYDDINNLNGENVVMYCEDILDKINKNDYVNIFFNESWQQNKEMSYLGGILILLNRKILCVLKALMKDPINNIKERTKFTINKIIAFSDDISRATSADWSKEALKNIPDEKWNEIEEEINAEISSIEKNYFSLEVIDTELMETVTESQNCDENAVMSLCISGYCSVEEVIDTELMEPVTKTQSTDENPAAASDITETVPDKSDHPQQMSQLVDEMVTTVTKSIEETHI